ncbi:MAG TPA: methyltransferase domain-containing protein [Accumulibacter sp.]|nr:methyltransferase domain-containing protein [Accumulibacter sp.]HMW18564.1 methyltransferase domain-containing protein [Accumulibacter sp.]HMX22181.1 methyltransferase domain-containing protein [Accumulibacter sp.]HMY07211.1 methyltransferase domain-containing protein [Accumulibacter sp.]HNC17727.1 methyltransferase domain-containing protein [Accumulibacter sp.]
MSTRPDSQNPALPAFWDHRFRNGVTPWDAGGIPAEFAEFIARSSADHRRRALVPGCGSAWEAACLVRHGWQTTALDFSPAAIDSARLVLGAEWPGTLLCADFFTFDAGPGFDLIYERAFLCALPPRCRADFAVRMAELLRPGGLLVGYFFCGDTVKGPPFAIPIEQLDDLLRPAFAREADQGVSDSLPVFAGGERWQIWRRR